MPRPLRLLAVVLPLAGLVACGGGDLEESSLDPSGLGPAARAACTGEVADLLGDVYPEGGLLESRLARCAVFQRQFQRGQTDAALSAARTLIESILQDASNGFLEDPPEGTLEEALEALFTAILESVGADPQGVVVVQVDETGGQVNASHASLFFDPGDVSGDTWVTILELLPPGGGPWAPGQCPFAFPVPYACYPLFFDFSLDPASNLLSDVTAGVCVVDTGPTAPPDAATAARLRLASEDHLNPGTLIFWPTTTPPPGLDCSDLAFVPQGWQGSLLEAMGPLARVFRVAPAWANPGSLGGSISSFSPFAPTDPGPPPSEAPVLLSPPRGAVIEQNDPATGCAFENGTWGFRIPFDWSEVDRATSYEMQILKFPSAVHLDVATSESEYDYLACGVRIEDSDLEGWGWRARGLGPAGAPGPWMASRFSFGSAGP